MSRKKLKAKKAEHEDMGVKPAHADDYDFDLNDGADEYCEHCHNTGQMDCHCGGDLCVCMNNGTYPCPHCQ